MTAVIRRFDEHLTNKANKKQIESVYDYIQKECVTQNHNKTFSEELQN
jgi:hypothetical protein